MKDTLLKYGSYGLGVGFVIFMTHLILGVKHLDSDTNVILGYISIFLSLSFIYFGIKHYRDKVNNGVISFSRALGIGIAVSILVAIGIAVADFVYTKFIDPEFFIRYEQSQRDEGHTDDIMELTSATAALFMLVLVTIIGFIISLLSGFILQRKR